MFFAVSANNFCKDIPLLKKKTVFLSQDYKNSLFEENYSLVYLVSLYSIFYKNTIYSIKYAGFIFKVITQSIF